MANYNFYSYVANLIGRGKTTSQINELVKKNDRWRSTTNRNITDTIGRVKAAKSVASTFTSAKPSAKIGNLLTGKAGKGSKGVKVDFSFNYEFSKQAPSGRKGKQKVAMAIDVDPNLSKKEVRQLIREFIDEWIQDNADSGSGVVTYRSITITHIIGV